MPLSHDCVGSLIHDIFASYAHQVALWPSHWTSSNNKSTGLVNVNNQRGMKLGGGREMEEKGWITAFKDESTKYVLFIRNDTQQCARHFHTIDGQ